MNKYFGDTICKAYRFSMKIKYKYIYLKHLRLFHNVFFSLFFLSLDPQKSYIIIFDRLLSQFISKSFRIYKTDMTTI